MADNVDLLISPQPERSAGGDTSLQAPHLRAIVGWALVVMVALMSYYVHVLNVHLEQAQAWQEHQRTAQPIAAHRALLHPAPERRLQAAR